MTPLSNIQKRAIAQLARRAYQAWPERADFERVNSEHSRTACLEAWRHVEQGKACGVQSLRECTQAHYGRLLAHFKRLAGDVAGAIRTLVRDKDNDRRIARWKLDEALRERGLHEGYAAKICRSKYKCSLDEASPGQLWKLVFDIRTRRKPVAAKVTGDNPF